MLTYAVLVLYGLLVLVIAYFGRSSRSLDSYLLADRSVSTVGVGAATFSLIGGGELVALTSLAFQYGASAICLFVGYAVGFFSLGLLAKRIRGTENKRIFVSLPDYMYDRCGTVAGHFTFACSFGAFFALLMLQFSAGGLLLGQLGGVHTESATIAIGVLITAYLAMGGFKTVITTDVIQGSARILLIPLLLFAALSSTQASTASAVGVQAMPAWVAIGLIATGFFTAMASADVWQRVYAAKDPRSAKYGLWMGAALMLAFGYVLVQLGVVAQLASPTSAPDDAFVSSIRTGLPDGASTAAIVLVLISVVSTADTEIFLLATLVQAQINRYKKPESRADQPTGVTLARAVVIFAGVLSTTAALFFTDLVTIYLWLIAALLILSPIVIASILMPRNPRADTASLILSFVLFTVLAVTGQLTIENAVLIVIPGLIASVVIRRMVGVNA